jgi:hypothetical protein
VVHLLIHGVRLKTVPSRLTTAHLPRLLDEGARSAGPAPIVTGDAKPGMPVEVDRLVSANRLIGLAGHRYPVGIHFAGRRVTVRLDRGLLQLIADGTLLRSLPNPLTPTDQTRIRDARPAGPPPRPADLVILEFSADVFTVAPRSRAAMIRANNMVGTA